MLKLVRLRSFASELQSLVRNHLRLRTAPVGIIASTTDPAMDDSTRICPSNSASRSLIPANPIPGAAPPRNRARISCGIPFPSSATLKSDVSVAAEDADIHRPGSRMTVHIRQCFLKNAKQSNLNLSWQPLDGFFDEQRHFDLAPFSVLIDIPAGSRQEPKFLQQRRMQKMRNRPYFLDCVVGQSDGLADHRSSDPLLRRRSG